SRDRQRRDGRPRSQSSPGAPPPRDPHSPHYQTPQQTHTRTTARPRMIYPIALVFLLAILTIAAYVDRVYSEMGKFLAREYQDNVDSWEELAEPRLRLGRESLALSASVLRQLTVAALALLAGLRLYPHTSFIPTLAHVPPLAEIGLTAVELILL